MRVIGGKFRSRPLLAPAGLDTRPTADRLRETLFNVLTQGAVDRIDGKAFLDLYAGSGAVGIEALSRGAARVTFVESGTAALGILQKNLANLGVRPPAELQIGLRIERRSVAALLKRETARYDVVFLDPPYELAKEYAGTLGSLGGESSGLLAAGAVVVAEHRRKSPLEDVYGRLVRTRVLEQGDAALSLYEIG